MVKGQYIDTVLTVARSRT